MAYGLQVFDSSGNTILDTGRLTRLINTYLISIGDGAVHAISCPGIVPNSNWGVIPKISGISADDSMYSLSITLLTDIIRLQFIKGVSGMTAVTVSLLVYRY